MLEILVYFSSSCRCLVELGGCDRTGPAVMAVWHGLAPGLKQCRHNGWCRQAGADIMVSAGTCAALRPMRSSLVEKCVHPRESQAREPGSTPLCSAGEARAGEPWPERIGKSGCEAWLRTACGSSFVFIGTKFLTPFIR